MRRVDRRGSLAAMSGTNAGRVWERLWRPDVAQVALSLLDQGVVSGASFATTLLLGRLAGFEQLGLYMLGFSMTVLALAVHDALVAAPYIAWSNRLRGARARRYAGATLLILVGLGVALALALGLTAGGLLLGGARDLAVQFAVLAWAGPLVVLREFVRRHAFARLNLRAALACDTAVACLQVSLLAVLAWTEQLSGWTAQAAIGVACGLVAAGFLWRDRSRFEVRRRHVGLGMQRNWRIGRWSLAGLSLAALGGHFVNPWLLAILLDERATGLFGACAAVLAFSNPLLLAASNLLSPRTARAYAAGGTPAVTRMVRRSTALLSVSMMLFCGAVALWGERLMELLFGRLQPGQHQMLLVLALSTFVAAAIVPADIGLWAVERADINFRSRLAGVVFTALGSLALIHRLGLVGAAYGQLLGNLAAATVTGLAYRSILHDRPAGGAGSDHS